MTAEGQSITRKLSADSTSNGTCSIWQRLTQRFGRVTSGGRLVPCVDGLRCIAIMAVMLYHLNGFVVQKAIGFTEQEARETAVFHWLHGANCGVQVFFSISGFILALPFAREKKGGRTVGLKSYYFRRLTRLEPPFLLNLLVVFALLILVKHQTAAELWAPLLATMTYTHNWFYGELSRINGVTWSLEIEVQFYLLAPFLARAFFAMPRLNRRVVTIGMIAVFVAIKIAVPVDGVLRLRLGLLYVLDHFLAGILLADVFVCDWLESPVKSKRWDIATLPLLLLIFAIQRSDLLLHLLPGLTAGLLACAIRGHWTNKVLSLPLIVIVGGMCYSIYLYHFFVISLIGRYTLPLFAGHSYTTQFCLQSLMIVPATIAICSIFFLLIEKPFMQWRPFHQP